MIAAGQVTGKATGSFDFGTAKTGTEQIAVEFELLEGESTGQCMTWYGYFSEAAKERTVQSLRYAGWRGDDITNLDGLGERRVTLVIEHERGNDGKVRAKIAWVNRFGGAGVKLSQPMDDKARRQFAAKMKVFAKAAPELPPEDPALLHRQVSNGNGASHSAAAPDLPGADDAPPHTDDDCPI